jgi:hypothetical protein
MTQHSFTSRKRFFIRIVARLVASIWRWNNDHEGQRPFLGRFTAHLAVLLTLAILILLGNIKLDSIASITNLADTAVLVGLAQNVDAATSAQAVEERPYYRIASQARIVLNALVWRL